MKEILFFILDNIINDKDNLLIDCEESNDILRFKIKVSAKDRGKLIGKDGKVVKSIRNFFSIISKKNNKRVFIEVV